MRNVFIFLGPPGAGKGTQALKVSQELEIPFISTGDMLRNAVKKGTTLGKEAGEYMKKGELVPDEIVIGIIKERLREDDCRKGCILDGFPRTRTQAEALNKIVEDMGNSKIITFFIDVPDDEVIARNTKRRVCANCGAVYHLENNPPSKRGICDSCGGELVQRNDDKEEVVRERLRVYKEKTYPLLEFYRDKGLVTVEGVGEIEEVYSRIISKIKELDKA